MMIDHILDGIVGVGIADALVPENHGDLIPHTEIQQGYFNFVLQVQEQNHDVRGNLADFFGIPLDGKGQGMGLEAEIIARVLIFIGQNVKFIPIPGEPLSKVIVVFLPVVEHIVGNQQDFFHFRPPSAGASAHGRRAAGD